MKVTKTLSSDISLEEVKSILCQHLKADPADVTVTYVLHDISTMDSRFPHMAVQHIHFEHKHVEEVPDSTSAAAIIARYGK